MRGMILAAGRGKRMGDLTSHVPKALLRVGDHYLIEYSLISLAKLGVKDIIINICYRGDQIIKAIGTGQKYGVKITYSEEHEPLETGGGIYQALPLLGKEPFIVLSCDVITDYPLEKLPKEPEGTAHLILVNNPAYHPQGDFCLREKKIYYGNDPTLTFANVGVYRPEIFSNSQFGKFRLGVILKEQILQGNVTGETYQGIWHNLGSPEDLSEAQTVVLGMK